MALTTRTLALGDPVPLFNLPNCDEKRVIVRDMAGLPLVLLFFANDQVPECAAALRAFQARFEDFDNAGVRLCSISMTPTEERLKFAEEYGIEFPMLTDEDESISRKYGVMYPDPTSQNPGQMTYSRAAILVDENLRVAKVYKLTDHEETLKELFVDIPHFFPQREPEVVLHQAPVLLIPRVISHDFCKELIRVWHEEGNEDSGFMVRDGEKTVGVYDYNKKIRRDHFVHEGPLRDKLDSIMLRRVFPEVKKCFNYECTRREEYKISCYDSNPGGFFKAHRDNTTGGTAHRRFAMSLNLNTEDYEGGYLRFAEYSSNIYRPETGDAIIFSGSMLHEATNVTSGKRFVLLSFFYGDKEAQDRLAYTERHGDKFETIRKSPAI